MSVNKIIDIGQVNPYIKIISTRNINNSDERNSQQVVNDHTIPADSAVDVTQSAIFSKMHSIQDVKSKLSEVAISIRAADTTMDTIGKILKKMEAQLEGIVKNYPPFSQNDPERVKMLKSLVSLRREIDRLTVPPDDYGAMKIMSDQGETAAAGDWNIELGGSGQTLTIHRQPVHTGPDGLNIPEIEEGATDEELQKTMVKINAAQEVLQTRRTGLAENRATNGT